MLLCRRLLFTADPQYPAVTLFAKLPSLGLHINEHKVGVVTDYVLIKVFSTGFPGENNVHFVGVVEILLYLVSRVQVLDRSTVHCFGIRLQYCSLAKERNALVPIDV